VTESAPAEGNRKPWQKDVGSDGVLRVAHSAVLAAIWLGAEKRRIETVVMSQSAISEAGNRHPTSPPDDAAVEARAMARGRFSEEDESIALQNLSGVWECLG